MYALPELDEYTDEWIQAERVLAINSFEYSNWNIPVQKESPQNNDSDNTPLPDNNNF
jgi:hypothetical protein